MRCPFCGHLESKVIDSRISSQGEVIRRRRECEACAARYTSYERVEETLPAVIKKDQSRQMFERQKILAGMRRASEKRPVATSALEVAADRIERLLVESGEKEVPSTIIGEHVMSELRKLDDVAYVRFASVYRSFKDLDAFREELDRIEKTREKTEPSKENFSK